MSIGTLDGIIHWRGIVRDFYPGELSAFKDVGTIRIMQTRCDEVVDKMEEMIVILGRNNSAFDQEELDKLAQVREIQAELAAWYEDRGAA